VAADGVPEGLRVRGLGLFAGLGPDLPILRERAVLIRFFAGLGLDLGTEGLDDAQEEVASPRAHFG